MVELLTLSPGLVIGLLLVFYLLWRDVQKEQALRHLLHKNTEILVEMTTELDKRQQEEQTQPEGGVSHPENALPSVEVKKLPKPLQQGVKAMGWPGLMPVQEHAIPYFLEDRELIVQSRTGSGKTGAFQETLKGIRNCRKYGIRVITLALGHDISGQPIVADLAKMPHLLVAGTTGSGKSVGVNAMLLSVLYKATPEDVRLLLVDPKMLELSVYEGVPHLLAPVITDMKDAATGLRWCVGEMERRYKLMAALGVRNLAGYNKKVGDAIKAGTPIPDPLWRPDEAGIGVEQAPELATLPFIVVVNEEIAYKIMIVGKKVEQLIARIAQKARAAGIHMILATQRPSVDVITGLIKANIPTRIAFQVSSKIDSRTILDQGGAEQLLGHGDMLYLPPGTSLPMRVHGAFVDDHEVHNVVADWKRRGTPNYLEEIFSEATETAFIPGFSEEGAAGGESDAEADPLYDEAVAFVTETRKASISSVQRKLRIGYNRAARLIEQMEAAGVVSDMSSNGNREVLAPPPPR